MIKFKGQTGIGRVLLGFGLSEMNIEKLKEGKPIYFFGEEFGMPGHDVLILYGKTEADMEKELKEAFKDEEVD